MGFLYGIVFSIPGTGRDVAEMERSGGTHPTAVIFCTYLEYIDPKRIAKGGNRWEFLVLAMPHRICIISIIHIRISRNRPTGGGIIAL